MSDPSNVRQLGKHPRWERGGGREETEPLFRTFQVGKPVSVDCREALRAYVLGQRRGPVTVQWLVRGHWRNQPCGPGLTDRKGIWIMPHWKGPADAPINLRPHLVGKDDTGA
jgi:hypothetical protein